MIYLVASVSKTTAMFLCDFQLNFWLSQRENDSPWLTVCAEQLLFNAILTLNLDVIYSLIIYYSLHLRFTRTNLYKLYKLVFQIFDIRTCLKNNLRFK